MDSEARAETVSASSRSLLSASVCVMWTREAERLRAVQ